MVPACPPAATRAVSTSEQRAAEKRANILFALLHFFFFFEFLNAVPSQQHQAFLCIDWGEKARVKILAWQLGLELMCFFSILHGWGQSPLCSTNFWVIRIQTSEHTFFFFDFKLLIAIKEEVRGCFTEGAIHSQI